MVNEMDYQNALDEWEDDIVYEYVLDALNSGQDEQLQQYVTKLAQTNDTLLMSTIVLTNELNVNKALLHAVVRNDAFVKAYLDTDDLGFSESVVIAGLLKNDRFQCAIDCLQSIIEKQYKASGSGRSYKDYPLSALLDNMILAGLPDAMNLVEVPFSSIEKMCDAIGVPFEPLDWCITKENDVRSGELYVGDKEAYIYALQQATANGWKYTETKFQDKGIKYSTLKIQKRKTVFVVQIVDENGSMKSVDSAGLLVAELYFNPLPPIRINIDVDPMTDKRGNVSAGNKENDKLDVEDMVLMNDYLDFPGW